MGKPYMYTLSDFFLLCKWVGLVTVRGTPRKLQGGFADDSSLSSSATLDSSSDPPLTERAK